MQLALAIVGLMLAQRPRPTPPPRPTPRPRPPPSECTMPCDPSKYSGGASATTAVVCEAKDGSGECVMPRGTSMNYYFCSSDFTPCAQQGVTPSPPAPMPTISFLDAIKQSGQGKLFLTEAIKYGFDKTLIGPVNGMTLFIPSDKAMEAVSGAYSKANSSVQQDWLRNHMNANRQQSGIKSTELTDGGSIMTLDNQFIFSLKTAAGGWSFSNADMTVTADVTTANIQGYTGPSTGPVGRGIAHIISRVLVPITFTPGATCRVPSKLGCGREPSEDICKRAQPPTGADNADCAVSTIASYGRGGTCCKDNCFIFRHNKGTGDRCQRGGRPPPPPRPTPPPGPPAPGPLPPCSKQCSRQFKRCVDQKDVESCINAAGVNHLCGPNCNASSLTNFDCGGGRVQECIMSPECDSTCEDPIDMAACKAAYSDKSRECTMECHCPWGQTYDEELAKCVDSCGDGTSCTTEIAQDYLDSGIAAAKCPDNSIGAHCKARCMTFTCVAHPDYADMDYMDQICARNKDEETCTAGMDRGGRHLDICQWIGADTGYPPSFVCSTMTDGQPIWTIDKASQCQAGGGGSNEVCDYFKETQCLTRSSCDSNTWSDECEDVASNVVKTCKGQCGGFADPDMRDDKSCAGCIFDELMKSNTVAADVTDAVACCGCLDEAFLKVLPGISKLTAETLNDILYSPCLKKPDVDVDDDDKTRA